MISLYLSRDGSAPSLVDKITAAKFGTRNDNSSFLEFEIRNIESVQRWTSGPGREALDTEDSLPRWRETHLDEVLFLTHPTLLTVHTQMEPGFLNP